MKTKYPSMFGLLAAVLLVASFVIPVNLMNPAPVEAGVCKWDTINLPGSLPLKNDIRTGSEIIDMAVGSDGRTVVFIGKTAISRYEAGLINFPDAVLDLFCPKLEINMLYFTNNGGISFTGSKFLNFIREWKMKCAVDWAGELMYNIAIAPDNPNFWAVTTDNCTAANSGPKEVWVTSDAGNTWQKTGLLTLLAAGETIRAIDVSVDYGGYRDIAAGTFTNGGTGKLFIVPSTGFGTWREQLPAPVAGIDYFALKFSPTYPSDASIAVVYANAAATFYNIARRDINLSTIAAWAYGTGTEIKDPNAAANVSPGYGQLNKVDLELPSDFSGQAASLSRAYVSLDAYGSKATLVDFDGIFRIDDTIVYVLMDTHTITAKSIYSIAYFGTYASGKLLAGERMGNPCTATVPTWFTDSPTTCPIPCWYPALKPTTGAAGVYSALAAETCSAASAVRDGGALVGWRSDGQIAYVATSSSVSENGTFTGGWYGEFLNTTDSVKRDETAFAISRNNGETWNQIAYIDTAVTSIAQLRFTKSGYDLTYSLEAYVYLTDVAVTPDCKTAYLAWNTWAKETYPDPTNAAFQDSVSGRYCDEFDSVWRSSNNPDVVAPYPSLPLGTFWERVLTDTTSPSCDLAQTDEALLRLVPYCADPTGQIVAWGVYDPDKDFTTGIAMWSPDYGDYWASVNPRYPIQDFCFESNTVMYFLNPDGLVQKMPYTGTAWGTSLASVDTLLMGAHTIAAYPEGKVLVGASHDAHSMLYATSFASNFNTDTPSFTVMSLAGKTDAMGNVHVAFDPKFNDNSTIFIADEDGSDGSVYRNTPAAQIPWADVNMMSASNNGAIGCYAPHETGQYGLILSFTGEALYSAHDGNHGVCRTIDDGTGKYGPLSGMPKPGIAWDCLDVFVNPPQWQSDGVCPADNMVPYTPFFGLEPTSLKACGCCTLETDTTLWAIDDEFYYPGTPNCYDITCSSNATWYQSIDTPWQRTGMVWSFTDCMAKRGPKLITEDKTLIGCDPVSGRAQEVNFCWEQLCVASEYDIEVAKSADFSIRIIDWTTEDGCGGLAPVDVTKPCAYFPAGGGASYNAESDTAAGGSAIAFYGNLECGHTYFWRVKVRECATGQYIRSPWSEARSFTVKAGLPVTTPYYGPQLLAPNNGCLGCPASSVSFSWSPFKETTKYEFLLASDAALTQVLKQAQTTTTAFEYDGTLEYGKNYFWQVKALEPAPSDPSATFSFQTEAAPSELAGPAATPPTPLWVWVIIAIGAILVIVTLVLIFKTRRV